MLKMILKLAALFQTLQYQVSLVAWLFHSSTLFSNGSLVPPIRTTRLLWFIYLAVNKFRRVLQVKIIIIIIIKMEVFSHDSEMFLAGRHRCIWAFS